MRDSFDLFVCGLCQFVTTPFPVECPQCNRLYCEHCVKSQRSWMCTGADCRSRQPPVRLNNNVREIMELLIFECPGCGERKRYQAFFEHVKNCDRISEENMTSNEQM